MGAAAVQGGLKRLAACSISRALLLLSRREGWALRLQAFPPSPVCRLCGSFRSAGTVPLCWLPVAVYERVPVRGKGCTATLHISHYIIPIDIAVHVWSGLLCSL